MLNRLSISSFKKFPWALGGCLLVLLGLELIARHYSSYFLSFADHDILYKKDFIEKTVMDYDGIFIGDSRILGVDAKFISDRVTAGLGRKVSFYNLSLSNHGARGYYLWLKKYLRHQKKPKVIVFSITPTALTVPSGLYSQGPKITAELHRFCLLYSIQDMWEVFPPAYFFPALIGKIERRSVFVTYRRGIRDIIENPRQLDDRSKIMISLTNNRNGGVRFARVKNFPEIQAEVLKMPASGFQFVADQDSVYWLQKFLLLAQDQGISVIWVNAPLREVDFRQQERSGENNKYRQWLYQLNEAFPALTVLEPPLEGYDSRFFVDGQHLDGDGFAIFGRQLAARLTEHLRRNNLLKE